LLAKKDELERLSYLVQNNKEKADMEAKLISKHVKDSRDKTGELIKKFELTVQKMERPGAIPGAPMPSTGNGNGTPK
jgi:hypothetical protein